MVWKKEFLEVDSMVVSWWIVAFLPSVETAVTSGVTKNNIIKSYSVSLNKL